MNKRLKSFAILVILFGGTGFAQATSFKNHQPLQDSISKDDSTFFAKQLQFINAKSFTGDSVIMERIDIAPYVSIQHALKGQIPGIVINERSGEPGARQDMLLRGAKQPIIYKSDLYSQQPIVYLDGIPLIGDHPFVYDIQKDDFISIGPATDYLAGIDLNNVASIEVIKDPVKLAILGPLANNGAIWITSKQAKVGQRQISINSFFGTTTRPSISPVNADYENRFRTQFYNKYADYSKILNYAAYLRDSTNTDYYGPTTWHKDYYQSALTHNVNLSITGGSDRANFRFYGGVSSVPGAAENTKFDRYTGTFYINMVPFSWMTMSSMVNVTRTERDRNKSLRERFSETRYLPDLSNPLPPGGEIYKNYLTEYDKSIDDNVNNLIKGYLSLKFNLSKKLTFVSKFAFDYNESIRDVFWPSTLMETNNFVSNYFGYNQRYNLSNHLSYKTTFNEDHHLDIDLEHSIWADKNKYNYALAYDGPSDFIKVNVVNGATGNSNYLTPVGFMTYRYIDSETHRINSFAGSATYGYKDLYDFSVALRSDGSSNRMPDKRWFIGGGASASANLKNIFTLPESLNSLKTTLSYARMGDMFLTDRLAYGPGYRVDLGWDQEPVMLGYNGFATTSRPYTQGWSSYDIETPYSNKFNFQVAGSLFDNRLMFDVDLYTNTSNNLSMLIPVPQEYGYKGKFASGMEVNNKGAEINLGLEIFRFSTFKWSTAFNIGYNKNTLKALPNKLDELVINDRKFEVGKSVDQFWLLSNTGIYENDADVPKNTAGERLSYKGVALAAGDPRWEDTNKDGKLDDSDKVLKGHMIAPFNGGWTNKFQYKQFDLTAVTSFSFGHKALNNAAANYYDFINNEQANNLSSIKEIYHWQQNYDLTAYPIYNPWSATIPYRKDQDLFLENASYLKLRTVTLGYDLSASPFLNKNRRVFQKFYIYATATNLLTLTKFTGVDPELVSFTGNYDGTGLPFAKSFIIGVKIDL